MNNTKPTPLGVKHQSIPDELKCCDQWVAWKYTWKDNKWTKPPYSVFTSRKTSPTDPNSFASFAEAYAAYEEGGYDGVGFCLTQNDPYVGIDLDHCVDESGKISTLAQEIVDQLDSYTEVSPSGEGLRIIAKAQLPAAVKRSEIEMYGQGRYLTITGREIGGNHADWI